MTALQTAEYRQILNIGADVLKCHGTDALIETMMPRLSSLLACKSMFIAITHSRQLAWQNLHSVGLDQEFPLLMERLNQQDPGRTALMRSQSRRRSGVLNSDMIWPTTREPRDAYYTALYKPRDIRHALALSIPTDDDLFATIVMHRSHRDGHFSTRDEQVALTLLPFLKGGIERICYREREAQGAWLLEQLRREYRERDLLILNDQLDPVARWPQQSPLLQQLLADIRRGARQPPLFAPDLAALCRQGLAGSGDDRQQYRLGSGGHELEVVLSRYRQGQRTLLVISAPSNAAQGSTRDAITFSRLTPREALVARQAARGARNDDIAHDLGIASSTVAHHLSAVRRKTGQRMRWQLGITPALLDRVSLLPLGRRQKQVLHARLLGKTISAIADDLKISDTTVRNHLCMAYRRLGVSGLRGVLARLSIENADA
jgi:DNA-binding NarL/FixJ family response regulator